MATPTQFQPMAIEPVIEQRRQDYLDWLYLRSRRTNGLYSGLVKERIKQLVQKDMDDAIGPLGDWK